MFVSCPKCSTKFLVPDDALGETGRKVRCGSCEHIWHQEPLSEKVKEEIEEVKQEQEENLAQAEEDEKKGVEPKLPAVYEVKKAPRWLKIAAIILFVVNCFGFVIFYKSVIGHTSFYDLVGQYETEGVFIEKVVMLDPYISKDGIIHYVDWIVKNGNDETREIPMAKLTMLDSSKNEIKSHGGSLSGTISPNGEHRFKANKIQDKGKKGHYLILEIGNPSEVSSR